MYRWKRKHVDSCWCCLCW